MKKKILIYIILYFVFFNAYAQTKNNKQISIEDQFERGTPIYLLQNICKESGLKKVINEFSIDDRVGDLSYNKLNSDELFDEIAIIYFNDNIIEIPIKKNKNNYNSFNVYFRYKTDAKTYGTLLALMLDYRPDPNDSTTFLGPNFETWIKVNLIEESEVYFVSAYFLYCD